MKKAIQAIEKEGILLVYPRQNSPEPKSIWSTLYPRSRMKWEWDDDGDDRVADLWHLRTELSESGQVVYAKWFQGRATFFSHQAFMRYLSVFQTPQTKTVGDRDSARILDVLHSDSPLSVKILKQAIGLPGRRLEGQFMRAMKPLWQRLYIVGFGEVQDSSFPSLAVGSSQLLHEGLWDESKSLDPSHSLEALKDQLGEKNPFFRFGRKIQTTL